jgi:hypothetical protein
MKTRYGFVSNSSSSSFVVAFPTNLELTEQSVHDYLYPNGEEEFSPWSHISSKITSHDAVNALLSGIVEQRKLLRGEGDPKDAQELYDSIVDHFDEVEELGAPVSVWERLPDNYYSLTQAERDAARDAASEIFDREYEAYVPKVKEYLNKMCGEGVELMRFSFSDNDGRFWSIMEHGGIFHNVKHWAVSHH